MKLLPTTSATLLGFVCLIILSCCKKDEEVTKPPLSSASSIKSFSFNNFSPIVKADIDESSKTIKFSFPPATEPTNLIPTIEVSDSAKVSDRGIAKDFTIQQTYIVTAQDGIAKTTYTTELLRPLPSDKDIPKQPKYLCIYYGYPSLINGSNYNIDNAVNEFIKYDIIVFGNGLSDQSHDDKKNTIKIINKLKSINQSIKIYGYVNVALTTSDGKLRTDDYSEERLKKIIDDWGEMGVSGVFGDNFGNDYGVLRPRQNVFIDYAHSKNLSVFANGWWIDQVLGDVNGTPTHLNANDYYLMESFLVSNGQYTALNDNIVKANKAYYYMKTKKIGIACLATIPFPNQASSTSNEFKMSWFGTAMYNFDAYQLTDNDHSSKYGSAYDSKVFFYPNPIANYATSWTDFDWVRKASSTRYERRTNTHTLYIEGNGTNAGTGGY